jgi:hypothetical protein
MANLAPNYAIAKPRYFQRRDAYGNRLVILTSIYAIASPNYLQKS